MSLQGFGHFMVFVWSISMKTMEKCGGFVLYNNAENVPANEKESQLEVPRGEFHRLIGKVPVYMSTLNLHWLQIRINT